MAGSLASINIKFNADLKQFSKEMQNSLRDISKLGQSFSNVGKNLSVGVTAPLLGLGALAVKTAADFETLRTSLLSSFQGNQAAADNAFKTIEKFATTSPYQVEEVLNAFIKLKNLGLDPSEESLKSYGNTASAMGKSLDQMIEAVADATTGEFERLKEFGIKSKSEGDKVSFTFQGVTKTIGKNADEIQKYLLSIGNVNFAGAMDRQAQTFKGRLSALQDTLASFGDSIGTIILDFLSPLVEKLQELATYFKNLSPETQKVIVIVGALAAAIGPLLLVIGTMIQLIPVMASAFVAVKGAFLAFTAVVSANPLTAMAVALGLVIVGLRAYVNATNGAVSSTKLYNEVRENAAKSIAKEKAELDTLLKIAKDETLSKQQRQNAIDKLNKISPEYLGNLRLETINTNEAKKAIDAYNVALNQRALQQAVLSKKTELFSQLIETQNKDLSLTGNAFTDATQKASNYIFSLLGVETSVIKNRKELEQYIKASKLDADQAKAVRSAYEPLIKERENDVKNIQGQIDALDKFNISEENAVSITDNLTKSTTALANAKDKVFKAGTIAFYENEIKKLKEQQTELSTTKSAYAALQKQIDEYQSKIDNISAPIKALDLPAFNTLEFFDMQINELKRIQQETVLTAQAYEELAKKIKSLENQKLQIIDPASLITNSEAFKAEVDRINEQGQRFLADREAERLAMEEKAKATQEAYATIGQSFVDLFGSFSQGFVESLGIADEGMKGFVSSLVGTITKLIAMALSASMANSVQGATQSAVATGPGAVFAQPAFIATAIAGILSAFASIPKFETGGFVGGNSFTGDKVLARLNSGELVLNRKQQAGFFGMINQSGSNVNIGLDGAFKLTGSDLELVIERAIKKNNRTR